MENVRLEFNISMYKDYLEFQKKMMEMLLNKNIQIDVISKENTKTVENIISGNKVSIYA